MAEFPAAFDRLPVGLCHLDCELRITSLSRTLAKMSGRSAALHLGRTIAGLLPGIFVEIEQGLQRALAGEAVEDVEVRGEQGSPSEDHIFLVSLQPMETDAETSRGVLVSFLDI